MDHYDEDTKARVIRQVDHYFSDANLPSDEHLLAKTGGDGNGKVSIKHVMGFPKMRQFKGKTKVRDALRQSENVEIVDEQFIKRKIPLTAPLQVEPKLHHATSQFQPPKDKPWLTKAMMKPTGFEDGCEKPSTAEEQSVDDDLYHPNKSFVLRIETAVALFCHNRKMHETTRKVFEKYMKFGGFDVGPRGFTGKISKHEIEELENDRQAKALRLQQHSVAAIVEKGLVDEDGEGPLWYVDFERAIKAFLSTAYMEYFDWKDKDQLHTHMDVFRSFYNYLITQGVCPEFLDQIVSSREFCDAVEKEFPQLASISTAMPGEFCRACSMTFCRRPPSWADWDTDVNDERYKRAVAEAEATVFAAISVYGTDAQIQELHTLKRTGEISTIEDEELGLKIVGIDMPNEGAAQSYDAIRSMAGAGFIKPLGILTCERWEMPHAPPMDLPLDIVNAPKVINYKFHVDVDTLELCYVGMMFEAEVKKTPNGIGWIDSILLCWPSFYVLLPNERALAYREPGSPKAWMKKQNQKHSKERSTDESVVSPQSEEGFSDEN